LGSRTERRKRKKTREEAVVLTLHSFSLRSLPKTSSISDVFSNRNFPPIIVCDFDNPDIREREEQKRREGGKGKHREENVGVAETRPQ
jgi:hypothetical protein